MFDSSNTQGFATASTQDVTLVTTFALYVTFNAGKTSTPEIPQNNGATFPDLWYPSFTTGYVVCNTYNRPARKWTPCTGRRTPDASGARSRCRQGFGIPGRPAGLQSGPRA